MTTTRAAWGHGLATTTDGGQVLDAWYPSPALGERPADAPVPDELEALAVTDGVRGVRRDLVTTEVDLDAPPADPADAYLRLHLLSHCLVEPNTVNLDGLFGVLTNVVWTTQGPCAVDGFETTRARLQARGPVAVLGVDKFPRMTDYVVPAGVRIGDADRVRLGAHLASGTTVMHEGFVNFNAGTLGSSMVEGRISAGGRRRRRLGRRRRRLDDGHPLRGRHRAHPDRRRCLLGAKAGLGIALGDDCVVEAGLYLTAGTKVTLADGTVVKARTLSGVDGLLYRRNSVTGAVEARAREGHGVALNEALHVND